MAVPVTSTRMYGSGTGDFAGSTLANIWLKLFPKPTQNRGTITIYAQAANATQIWVAVVPRASYPGGVVPSSAAPVESDVTFKLYAGDTLPLADLGDGRNDVYVCAADLSAGVLFNATEYVL